MAPPKPKQRKPHRESSSNGLLKQIWHKYINLEFVKFLIFDPAALPIVSVLIIIAELVINVLVIHRVPYTEIDWIAYMQECEGFLNGTTNYAQLRGDTGPLVYPAAFVYIYSALYFITSRGRNIRLAQYIFIVIYLLQMWLVLRLYTKSRKVPPYVLVISAFTSYRIHSIYVLRLFNDPVAVLFLYAALNLFLDQRWTLGSLCFSLGVGVKMNILLFAPVLLLFYISNLGFWRTLVQLAICGTVQLLLGAPFLLSYPFEYLKGSFDLGRIFEHKWTVNYRFLDRPLFENKTFHLALLTLHLLLLCAFVKPTFVFFRNYVRLRELQAQLQPQIKRKNQEIKNITSNKKPKKSNATKEPIKEDENETLTNEQQQFINSFEKTLKKAKGPKAPPQPAEKDESEVDSSARTEVSIHFEQCTQLALLPIFLCNFIGVLCARSLHYQFYVWYFHSLPYLTWYTNYSLGLRFLILGLIEFSWNTYPSTNFSSAMLHACHLVLLVGVGRSMFKTMGQSGAVKEVQQEQDNQQRVTTKSNEMTKTSKTKAS